MKSACGTVAVAASERRSVRAWTVYYAPTLSRSHAPASLLSALLISCIRLYRLLLSPAKALLFGPLARCRFTPSCSEYAMRAVQTHGALP